MGESKILEWSHWSGRRIWRESCRDQIWIELNSGYLSKGIVDTVDMIPTAFSTDLDSLDCKCKFRLEFRLRGPMVAESGGLDCQPVY